MGDFNTLDTEIPNAFHNVIYNRKWSLSMLDAQEEFSDSVDYEISNRMPKGTYFFLAKQ